MDLLRSRVVHYILHQNGEGSLCGALIMISVSVVGLLGPMFMINYFANLIDRVEWSRLTFDTIMFTVVKNYGNALYIAVSFL
jgi:hypothetical protein